MAITAISKTVNYITNEFLNDKLLLDYRQPRGGFAISSAYIWYQYYKLGANHADEYRNKLQYYKTHNCVVTYSRKIGITGWPGFGEDTVHIVCGNFHDSFIPLLNFLNTTKATLDIAIMAITSNVILDALFTLAKRGVKLRFIINYDHAMKMHTIKDLTKFGAEVAIFVEKSNSNSIFHYKYAIKDYNTESSALCCSSLNWTNAAFVDNYESLVFTTNKTVVEEFHKNYTTSFDYVKKLMEEDVFVKVKLGELPS